MVDHVTKKNPIVIIVHIFAGILWMIFGFCYIFALASILDSQVIRHYLSFEGEAIRTYWSNTNYRFEITLYIFIILKITNTSVLFAGALTSGNWLVAVIHIIQAIISIVAILYEILGKIIFTNLAPEDGGFIENDYNDMRWPCAKEVNIHHAYSNYTCTHLDSLGLDTGGISFLRPHGWAVIRFVILILFLIIELAAVLLALLANMALLRRIKSGGLSLQGLLGLDELGIGRRAGHSEDPEKQPLKGNVY